MNTKDLRAFYWAATLGNLNKAAARLGLTQPTISQRIIALERALNVVLFHREPLRLTELGRRVLALAQRVS